MSGMGGATGGRSAVLPGNEVVTECEMSKRTECGLVVREFELFCNLKLNQLAMFDC